MPVIPVDAVLKYNLFLTPLHIPPMGKNKRVPAGQIRAVHNFIYLFRPMFPASVDDKAPVLFLPVKMPVLR
ncbi:hypothetical protein D3C77_310570 [compost metagenome]